MARPAAERMGLRERKKLRTRATIERVALELFAKRGFQATTLAEIAGAAEIAPSTLHSYFRSKDDIVFSTMDEARASARERVVGRPEGELAVDALEAWVAEDVPAIVGGDARLIQLRRKVIDGHDALLTQERLRLALLEDVLAEAFARDLDETPDDLRARLMAAVAVNALRTVRLWWYRRSDAERDPRGPYALDATYVGSLLRAAESALASLPSAAAEPPERPQGRDTLDA